MFAGLPILLAVWMAAQNGLPHDIAVAEIPGSEGAYEVEAGYRAGVRHEIGGRSGLAATAAAFLSLTPSGRKLTLVAYGSGGEISFFTELDRTGVRVKTPAWAKPAVDSALSDLFNEVPVPDSAALAHAMVASRELAERREADFAAQVEDQIRIALLGARAYHHPLTGWSNDAADLTVSDVEEFFRENFGTNRAFLSTSLAPPTLAGIQARHSTGLDRIGSSRPVTAAQRILRFPDQESGGALIFASPVTSVFYRGWYAVLVLDQVIRTAIPGNRSSMLVPTVQPYYYRFEIPVPADQTADMVEQTVMQELERLQYVRATEENLNRAKAAALQFLESRAVRAWFTSLELDGRRQEGMEWVRSFSADDLRVAARELLLANRVIALWSAKPKQLRIQTESLEASDPLRTSSAEPPRPAPLGAVTVDPFPSHPAHEDRITSQGPAASQNLPAALVFKVILDRRLIEAGLWKRGEVTLRPAESQVFVIEGSPTALKQTLEWVTEISMVPPAAAEVEWARETAVHRLEWAPAELPGIVASQLQLVTPEQLQDVARTHLENR